MAIAIGCSAIDDLVRVGAKAAKSGADDAAREASRQLPSNSDDAVRKGFKRSSKGVRQLPKLVENLSHWGADQAARELASLTTIAVEALAPRGTESLMKRVADEIILLGNLSSRRSAADGTEGLASQLAKGLVHVGVNKPIVYATSTFPW